MAIKDFYPAIRPTLDLNFAGSHTVDPRITFTRASTATYFDEFGVMRTAPANAPRIDFDPVTGECKGLLIEEQRTNLRTYSEQFDNAVLEKTNATITANAIVSPSGVLTADKIVETATTGEHNLGFSFSVTSGVSYTFSLFAKAGERRKLRILFSNSGFGTNTQDLFDLSTGAVDDNQSGGASIVSIGNGWYRVVVTKTATATAPSTFQIRVSNTAGATNYTGDGTSGIYIWGAQLEQGEFPSSYIPTTSAQVTRAADGMSITGSNFSSFFNANEGAVVIESEYFGPNTQDPTTSGIVSLSDGATNYFSIVARTDANSVRAVIAPGSSFITVNNNYPRNTSKKIALAYKNNDFGFCIGGEAVYINNTNQSNADINSLIIGAYYATTSRRLNGRIKQITIYNRRIANVQLQALTA